MSVTSEQLAPDVYDSLVAERILWSAEFGEEVACRLFEGEYARLVGDANVGALA